MEQRHTDPRNAERVSSASGTPLYRGTGESVVNALDPERPWEARATMRLLRRAKKGNWKQSAAMKQIVAARMQQIAATCNDEPTAISAANTLIAMDRANIAAMTAAAALENPSKGTTINLGVQVNNGAPERGADFLASVKVRTQSNG